MSILTLVSIIALYTISATSTACSEGYSCSTSAPTTWTLFPLSWTILSFTSSDLNTPLSSLLEDSALLISLTSISSNSLLIKVLVIGFSLLFFSILISSLIFIIFSALPTLFRLVFFPSCRKIGAILSVSIPLATIIDVIISVASIRTPSLMPGSSLSSMVSIPSTISSPSSIRVSTSFSFIQSTKASFRKPASCFHPSISFIFSNTMLYFPSFHLFVIDLKSLSIPLVFPIPSSFHPSGTVSCPGTAGGVVSSLLPPPWSLGWWGSSDSVSIFLDSLSISVSN